ncbi:MAG: DUF5684 domain-containing protein [Aristaeellaceae bacterium]
MSSYQMRQLESMLGGVAGNIVAYLVATLLSGVVLSYAMRWFIFKRAGEKGWKGLIPLYSDYIYYKIGWDGRIYLALLIGQIAATVLGGICGLINAVFGMVVSLICNVVVLSARAVAKMILQFKVARAFGRSDFFAVGLYFLNSVFSAVLAFGDSTYKGPQLNDGFGVPSFIDKAGRRAAEGVNRAMQGQGQTFTPAQPYQPAQPQQTFTPVQPQQFTPAQPYQPAQPQQPYAPMQPQQQGYPQMQQPYAQQPYQQPHTQRVGRSAMRQNDQNSSL